MCLPIMPMRYSAKRHDTPLTESQKRTIVGICQLSKGIDMPRPCKKRSVKAFPQVNFFKPRGIALNDLEVFEIGIDELEAIRLADLEGLYQADAAERMGVSRQTFGNIISSARKKVAAALTNGGAIRIENRSFAEPVKPHCRGRHRRGRAEGWNVDSEKSE